MYDLARIVYEHPELGRGIVRRIYWLGANWVRADVDVVSGVRGGDERSGEFQATAGFGDDFYPSYGGGYGAY